MKVEGDYIIASFMNEFEHADHSDFEEELRGAYLYFNNSDDYKKDL